MIRRVLRELRLWFDALLDPFGLTARNEAEIKSLEQRIAALEAEVDHLLAAAPASSDGPS